MRNHSWAFLWLGSAVCAAEPSAQSVIDRALAAAARTTAYSAEVVMRKETTPAAGKRVREEFRWTISYRAPGQTYVHDTYPREEITLKRDDVGHEFRADRPETITRTSLGPPPPGMLAEAPGLVLDRRSPVVGLILKLAARDSVLQERELFDGVLCDVIVQRLPIAERKWREYRQANPALPDAGFSKQTSYLAVEDGLLRRQITVTEVPAVMASSLDFIYSVRTLDSNEALTWERFAADVQKILGDRPFPKIESRLNATGREMPAIAATLADGRPLRWEEFLGKVVVIETFASWCTYCKAAMPFYEKIRRQVENQGVVFVALDFDADRGDYDRWLTANREKYGFTFARAEVDKTNWRSLLEQFKGSLPSFYVVGRDGHVAASYLGFSFGAGNEDPRLIQALQTCGIKL